MTASSVLLYARTTTTLENAPLSRSIDTLRRAGPIILILLLAAGLRILPVGISAYAWDEARISYDALRLTRGGQFLLFGQPSSVGVPFFPASVWAFAPPYAVSADPLIAVLYVAVLNTLMIGGVWWLARRWGAAPAAIAALFLAANPYAVLYSRSIWQPNLLAPLALAWLIAAFHGATATGRARAAGIAAAVALAGLGVQIHFAGVVLLPLTLYVFMRSRWYRSIPPLIMGGLIPLIAALPYGYAVLTTPDLLARTRAAAEGGLAVDLDAAGHLLRMILGWDWAYLGGG
ncbi:MAG: glycosyltransferase family 39 protein, partial [Anaerolinea sp.]|nr:glycosyltransferase family 39 protein [Anaerolinea sp.]